MVALGALSYLLRLDGQNSVADHYDQTNQEFIKFWLEHAKVSALFNIVDLSLMLCKLHHCDYIYVYRVPTMTTITYSMTYPIQHGR